MDWSVLITLVVVALSGAFSALSAYMSKTTALQTKVQGKAVRESLGVAERLPVRASESQASHAGEVAATILPWFPASYIPAWSQSSADLPDGSRDPQWYNDCGEACCAMAIAGVWGCPVEPGAIRQWLVGPTGSGLTAGSDLQRALRNWSVKSHVIVEDGTAAWNALQGVVKTQRPVIMLGLWPSANGALHWMIATGNGGDAVQFVDPLTGTRSYMSKADWLTLYRGQLVALDAHIHFDCRTWPNPA